MLKGPTQKVCPPQFDASVLLQRHPALRSLAGPEWDAALADATVLQSNSSHMQGFEGCKGDYFGIVLEGTIRVRSLAADGRIVGLCRVQAGELCMHSLTAIYSNQAVLVDLAAEGRVVVLQIRAHHLPILLSASEEFRSFLLRSMSRHVMTLLGRIEESTFGCLKSRILGHLRNRHEATNCSVIPVSHQELAEELGATREAVSRTLKQMERSGDVRLGRRRISLSMAAPEISTPVPRGVSPGAMETRRLRESFAPKLVPQRRPPDPGSPVACCKPADRSDGASVPVRPDAAEPRPGRQIPKLKSVRSL